MDAKPLHGPQNYTLYHHPYSICSVMVRYTLASAGPPRNPDVAMDVEERSVNIFHGEQLEEHFLEKVNSKGLVPVLDSQVLDLPMPDSLDITFYILENYPRLCPIEYRDTIKTLLSELHALNYFSLSFGTRPQQADKLLADVNMRLEGDISDEYREALEYKRQYTLDHKSMGVRPQEVERNKTEARALMNKLVGLLSPSKNWLFGLDHPTALDCHLVIFLARMKDVGQSELMTSRLLEYFDSASETDEYKRVMGGRSTMVGG